VSLPQYIVSREHIDLLLLARHSRTGFTHRSGSASLPHAYCWVRQPCAHA